MTKKTIGILVIFFLSPLLVYFFWPSEENRIRRLFRDGAAAVEAENIDSVMTSISFNYQDEYGMSYLTIKKGMEDIFKRWHDISVSYRIIDVQINGNRASAELELGVTAAFGEGAVYVLGDAGQPAAVKFSLEKERMKWYVTKTEGLPRME